MTHEERVQAAWQLAREHMESFEFLNVAEALPEGSDEDLDGVFDLVMSARVVIDGGSEA